MAQTRQPQRARLGLLLALGAPLVLSACIMVPVGHRYGGGGPYAENDDGDVVTVAPPAPQVEVVVAAPGPGYFWIGGYWGWIGGRHVWVGGRWDTYRPGWRWVPFGWGRYRHGWRASPGRWERH